MAPRKVADKLNDFFTPRVAKPLVCREDSWGNTSRLALSRHVFESLPDEPEVRPHDRRELALEQLNQIHVDAGLRPVGSCGRVPHSEAHVFRHISLSAHTLPIHEFDIKDVGASIKDVNMERPLVTGCAFNLLVN